MPSQGTASLPTAWRDGWALGAFSTYALEQTQAMCDAAAATRQPLILQAVRRQAFLASHVDVIPDVLEAADLTAVLGTARNAV